MRLTDNSTLQNRRRKFNRFDSSLFIEFRPLTGAASYFLGITNNISCDGLRLTFRNVVLEPGEKLQLKLRQPQTNTVISFLGDVIWQEETDSKFSAGIKFCEVKKKNKNILLKAISDCCNIPVKSLSLSSKMKSLNNFIDEQLPPAPEITAAHKLHSRIFMKERTKLSLLHKTTLVFTVTSAILFLSPIIDNFEHVSSKLIPELIKSKAIDLTRHVHDLLTNTRGQIQNRDMHAYNTAVQPQHIDTSTLFEVVEEDIPPVIIEHEHDITLPDSKKEMTDKNNFYIQIASLKDPDIAYGMLSELKHNYPSAYLFIQNNFYNVRIPNIKTSEQGYDLLKEIESTFGIKPVLVKKFQ